MKSRKLKVHKVKEKAGFIPIEPADKIIIVEHESYPDLDAQRMFFLKHRERMMWKRIQEYDNISKKNKEKAS